MLISWSYGKLNSCPALLPRRARAESGQKLDSEGGGKAPSTKIQAPEKIQAGEAPSTKIQHPDSRADGRNPRRWLEAWHCRTEPQQRSIQKRTGKFNFHLASFCMCRAKSANWCPTSRPLDLFASRVARAAIGSSGTQSFQGSCWFQATMETTRSIIRKNKSAMPCGAFKYESSR